MPIVEISDTEWADLKDQIQKIQGTINLLQQRYIGVQTALKLNDTDVVDIADTNKKIADIQQSIANVSGRLYQTELKTGIAVPIEDIKIKG